MAFREVMLALAVSAWQAAQPAPAPTPEPPNVVEEVVVTGRRSSEDQHRKAVDAFVRSLSEPTRRDRLARWQRAVCPGIVGLSAKHGGYIVDRIAQEAVALGLDVGKPGCKPDILILVTDRPNDVAKGFRAKHRKYFAHIDRKGEYEAGGGNQSLGTFLHSSRPVRWWHVAQKTDQNGQPIRNLVIRTNVSSRMKSYYREDLARVLVIVDSGKMKGITYEALASYLAMTSLAQLDPEASAGSLETVTTLFSDRDAGRTLPEGLTEHDRLYLQGLYAAPDYAKGLGTQRGAIRRHMMKAGQR